MSTATWFISAWRASTCIFVNHPDYVREILVTNQNNFIKSRGLQRAKVLLGEGLLTSEGQHHLRQRRLVQPAFHRERLAGYATAMSECAVRVRDRWEAGSDDGHLRRDGEIDALHRGEDIVQRGRGIGSVGNRRGHDRNHRDVPNVGHAFLRVFW